MHAQAVATLHAKDNNAQAATTLQRIIMPKLLGLAPHWEAKYAHPLYPIIIQAVAAVVVAVTVALDDSERAERDAIAAVEDSSETASAARAMDTDAVVMTVINMTVDEETTPEMLTGADLWIPQADDGVETYYDEITGMPLPRDEILKARGEELGDYEAMNVYKEISIEETMMLIGTKPVSSQWKDINKGDQKHIQVRSQLIGMEFKKPGVDSLFTATPPWMAFRAVFSSFMTRRCKSKRQSKVMFLLDVKRVFLNIPTRNTLCVTPPHLEGTLSASSDYQAAFCEAIKAVGLEESLSTPCCWHEAATNSKLCFHGEDIAIEGGEMAVDRIHQELGKSFQLVVKSKTGFGQGQDRTGILLNRCITLTDDETLVIDADLRHVDLFVAGCGLHNNSKAAKSPTQKLTASDYEQGEMLLESTTASSYRALVARVRYLAEDRADISYAMNWLCKGMSSPSVLHTRAAKHLARYLLGVTRLPLVYHAQSEQETL
eukprot:996923-Amphidinium_carterae.1